MNAVNIESGKLKIILDGNYKRIIKDYVCIGMVTRIGPKMFMYQSSGMASDPTIEGRCASEGEAYKALGLSESLVYEEVEAHGNSKGKKNDRSIIKNWCIANGIDDEELAERAFLRQTK